MCLISHICSRHTDTRILTKAPVILGPTSPSYPVTFLPTPVRTAEPPQPSYASHKRLVPTPLSVPSGVLHWYFSTSPNPNSSAPAGEPLARALDAYSGSGLPLWQGTGHQCQVPSAHLFSSTPQLQNDPCWKAAYWGLSCAHTLQKKKPTTEASKGTWPSKPMAWDTHLRQLDRNW